MKLGRTNSVISHQINRHHQLIVMLIYVWIHKNKLKSFAIILLWWQAKLHLLCLFALTDFLRWSLERRCKLLSYISIFQIRFTTIPEDTGKDYLRKIYIHSLCIKLYFTEAHLPSSEGKRVNLFSFFWRKIDTWSISQKLIYPLLKERG